jgi:hypothetical protein
MTTMTTTRPVTWRRGIGTMSLDDPRHGTPAGYQAHRRADQDACDDCRRAVAAAEARRTYNRMLGIETEVLVDATGTRRRLQALTALGWGWKRLSRHLDVSVQLVARWATADLSHVRPDTAAAVTAVYDRLSMHFPPETNMGERSEATRARRRASRNGWPPPLAWDNIDDPDAAARGVRTENDDHQMAAEDWLKRILAGDRPRPHQPARHIRVQIVAMWPSTGLSSNELERRTGWKPERYREGAAA